MKRLWIGIGLLMTILVLGLWTSAWMSQTHTAISEDLTSSAQAAQSGQWDRADAFAQDAGESWHDNWHFSAALADHTVLDGIDGLFAQAEVYRKNRDAVSYAAVCAQLAQAIDALHEGHRLSWWNLL